MGLGKIKFVCSIEPPSPQPSPARRERGGGRLQVKKRSSENLKVEFSDDLLFNPRQFVAWALPTKSIF